MKAASGDIGNNLLEALQAMNRYLAVINGRIMMLIKSDLPEYVISDLVQVYQAEQEVSQIVRSLNLFYHKTY